MFIMQPKSTVISNICKNDSTKHNYSTIKSHYNCVEFNNGFEKFKQSIDIEKLHKRLVKFLALTGVNGAYVYLGQMSLFNTSSSFDVFLNKDKDIVWGSVGYVTPITLGRTLSNVSMQNVTVDFGNNNVIIYYYNSQQIARYNVNEDTIEILLNDKIECINNFNAFLTQWCNKTLRVAVIIENKIEIMEISY